MQLLWLQGLHFQDFPQKVTSNHKAGSAAVCLPGLHFCACCQPASAVWPRHTAALMHQAWQAVIKCPHKTWAMLSACRCVQDAESPPSSDFEQQLLIYVKALKLPGTIGADVLAMIIRHDLSSARGHLVTSIPGRHKGKLLECQPMDTQRHQLLPQSCLDTLSASASCAQLCLPHSV